MWHIELLEWVFQGKFGYISQSSVIPQAAISTLQLITYQFIWGKQREVSWENMTKPRKCGGIGMRDFRSTQQSTIIDRACRMWEQDGIWNRWMCSRYVRGRSIDEIEKRQTDSVNWKAVMGQSSNIVKCVILGPHYAKSWIGKGTGSSIRNVRATLAPTLPTDVLAKCIWANKIGKVALNLWRIRGRSIPTKDRLIKRGMMIPGDCELCCNKQETIDHLFSGCDYTRWVLAEAMALRAIWSIWIR